MDMRTRYEIVSAYLNNQTDEAWRTLLVAIDRDIAPGDPPLRVCTFIEASDIFRDCPAAWSLFADSNPDCSWGDNNRTLITPDVITRELENADYDNEAQERQVEIVLMRLYPLSPDQYIDLEN